MGMSIVCDFCMAWVYRYIPLPVENGYPLLEFLNFSMYVVPYDWTAYGYTIDT